MSLEGLRDPRKWGRFHAVLTLAWFALVIPTILLWRESVLWVALMSCWANAAAHFGAWQSTRAEEEASNNNDTKGRA